MQNKKGESSSIDPVLSMVFKIILFILLLLGIYLLFKKFGYYV